MWRIRARQQQVVRAAPNVLFIIHCLRMRSSKNDRENWSGQNRTSRTACYGHVNYTKNRTSSHMLSNNSFMYSSMPSTCCYFSTGSKFWPFSNFTELHALTLATHSYAFLCYIEWEFERFVTTASLWLSLLLYMAPIIIAFFLQVPPKTVHGFFTSPINGVHLRIASRD